MNLSAWRDSNGAKSSPMSADELSLIIINRFRMVWFSNSLGAEEELSACHGSIPAEESLQFRPSGKMGVQRSEVLPCGACADLLIL